VLPSRRTTRQLPLTIEPTIDDQYIDRQVADQGEKYLVRICSARIVGENGLVILPDGAYASESIYTRSALEEDPDFYAPPGRPVVKKPGNYFSLLVIWSTTGNYYHWMHDTLERLFALQGRLPEDTKYIVPANLTPLQRETLRLVGLEEDQLAPFGGEAIWELETLYFSNCTSNSGSSRRDADEWLRDTILDAYHLELPTPTRRLLVSRKNAPSRQTVNEQAVAEYLRQFDFEICVPEALSFREEVELFTQAEVVVATHGAGLTNVLFAPPGLVVVDMIPASKMPWAYVYWTMSEELSHRYWYFVAEDAGDQGDTYVPIEKLDATIDRIGLD
jgi:capsular polysaccharide biosynthesis protein